MVEDIDRNRSRMSIGDEARSSLCVAENVQNVKLAKAGRGEANSRRSQGKYCQQYSVSVHRKPPFAELAVQRFDPSPRALFSSSDAPSGTVIIVHYSGPICDRDLQFFRAAACEQLAGNI